MATFFQNCTLILDKYPVVSQNDLGAPCCVGSPPKKYPPLLLYIFIFPLSVLNKQVSENDDTNTNLES